MLARKMTQMVDKEKTCWLNTATCFQSREFFLRRKEVIKKNLTIEKMRKQECYVHKTVHNPEVFREEKKAISFSLSLSGMQGTL